MTDSRPAPGPDLYAPVHKGLRRALFHVATALGATDWRDAAARETTLAALAGVLDLCALHADREDALVHPFARERGVEPARLPDAAHAALRGTLDELRGQARAVADASPDAVAGAARRLAHAFEAFVAHELEHMAHEEREIMPRLRERATPAQLAATQAAVLRSFSPGELAAFLGWIVPAVTADERARLARGLEAAVEGEALAAARAVLAGVAPTDGALRLLQIDFAFPGPFGDALAAALRPLAESIAGEAGLLWKLWTEDEAGGRAGGIYLFASEAWARAYLEKHRARLAGFGVHDVRAAIFAVNGPLSRLDRGPLPGA